MRDTFVQPDFFQAASAARAVFAIIRKIIIPA